MSFLAPLERDGIPLALAVVERTDEGAVGGGVWVNRAVERNWTVPPRLIQRVESGVANVGYV